MRNRSLSEGELLRSVVVVGGGGAGDRTRVSKDLYVVREVLLYRTQTSKITLKSLQQRKICDKRDIYLVT